MLHPVVLYTTSDPDDQAAVHQEYDTYADAHGWQITKDRIDFDTSESAWLRKGLLSCITIVCHGNAKGVLMPEAAFKTFSVSDQEWLRLRIQRFGGFLHIIPSTNEATPCVSTTSLRSQTP
jgi:hypothetical protein